jgi:hypothetical protein
MNEEARHSYNLMIDSYKMRSRRPILIYKPTRWQRFKIWLRSLLCPR